MEVQNSNTPINVINTELLLKEIEEAYETIYYNMCKKTPLEISDILSKQYGTNIYLKHEYQQHTGSFKLRGAANKVINLNSDEIEKFLINVNTPESNLVVVTASTGNHGSAVSYVCRKINESNHNDDSDDISLKISIECQVFCPENVSASKAEIIHLNKAKLIKVNSNDCLFAEKEAIEYVNKMNSPDGPKYTYISPYNDLDVIAGQGTIGIEIMKTNPRIDAIFVSVGGGGLISGITCYVKEKFPNCEIIACQPENSRVMYESLKNGKILEPTSNIDCPTLSDGTAGGVDYDSVTFELIKKYIPLENFVLANESEIAEALKILIEKEKVIVEGSAALTLACYIKTRERWTNKNVALVLCGKNISLEKLKQILI